MQAKKTVNYAESSDEDEDVIMPRKARQTRTRNRTRAALDDDEEDEYVGGNDDVVDYDIDDDGDSGLPNEKMSIKVTDHSQ